MHFLLFTSFKVKITYFDIILRHFTLNYVKGYFTLILINFIVFNMILRKFTKNIVSFEAINFLALAFFSQNQQLNFDNFQVIS